MTEQNPAIFLQSEAHPAEDVRRWVMALSGDGEGIAATGELAVSEKSGTADMSVDVATGRCFILGDEDTYQGTYFCDNRGTVNKAVTPADGSNPRIDRVVARVYDSEYSGASDYWEIDIIPGSPAASPSAPALPDSAIDLATIAVGTGVTSIVDANITSTSTVIVTAASLGARLTTAEADIVTNAGDISTNSSDITALEGDTAAISRSGTTTTITDTTLVDVNAATIVLDGATVNVDGSTAVNIGPSTTVDIDGTAINLDSDDITVGEGSGACEFEMASGNTAVRFGTSGQRAFGHDSSGLFFANCQQTASGVAELRMGTNGAYSKVIDITSSIRYKRNLKPLDAKESLALILKVQPTSFNSKIETDDPDEVIESFIAEQLAEVHEGLAIRDRRPGMEDQWSGINTRALLAHAVGAIQALEARIEELEAGQ